MTTRASMKEEQTQFQAIYSLITILGVEQEYEIQAFSKLETERGYNIINVTF